MSLAISNRENRRVGSSLVRGGQMAAAGLPGQKGRDRTPAADRVEWSSGLMAQPDRRTVLDLLRPEKKTKTSAESTAELLAEQMKIRRLCAKIAARIRAGDQVPMKDRRYLRQKDPVQYLLATLMQKSNDDPKRWETLLKGQNWEAREMTGLELTARVQTAAPVTGPSSSAVASEGQAPQG